LIYKILDTFLEVLIHAWIMKNGKALINKGGLSIRANKAMMPIIIALIIESDLGLG
jgi:hypothetical protein